MEVDLQGDFDFFNWYSINAPFGKIFRRKVLFKNPEGTKFDTELCVGEDLILYVQALLNSSKTFCVANTLYHYTLREGGAIHNGSVEHRYSDVIAWSRVSKFLAKGSGIYLSSKKILVNRCYALLCDMTRYDYVYNDESVKEELKHLLKKNREYAKYIDKSLRFKVIYRISYLFPRAFKLLLSN